ncbi:hypothetical protein MOV08_35685 [Streptomyces yunnanensis]|uniref:DUF6895 domain-containing protein n=1 Tax=Streptomyces yunnanensis TaxID=156453 RepID=A0ABY8AGH4_9ACTN|nr:hypothetical protein [Streptomyces yunnanensis]WEB44105.1 hypothetical protein MOV08_35685 [Streptomyces yunnanensis]
MTADRGDPELLDRVAGSSLGWLTEQREFFRLPPDATTDADPNLTLKPLGELAELTWMIATTHPCAELRAAAAELFAFAWQEAREGELFAELIRGEPYATYPVEIYGAFAQAGLRHPAVEELVLTTTRLRGWRVAREDHTRTLAVLNAERRIGLVQHGDFDEKFAQTWLGMLPEPWALDCRAAYGVTHDVLHLTDWGRDRRRLAPETAAYLRLWLPSWLETWLDEQLWDLVGELLAITAILPTAPYHAAAWRRLADAQDHDGGLPETGTAPRPTDPTEDFRACYHSTLVSAFAATLARIASDEAEAGPVVVGGAVAVAGPAPFESEAAL